MSNCQLGSFFSYSHPILLPPKLFSQGSHFTNPLWSGTGLVVVK